MIRFLANAAVVVVAGTFSTLIGSRLLGIRRGWVRQLLAGVIGWVLALGVAAGLLDWDPDAGPIVAYTAVLAVPATMALMVLFDLIARPGTLATGVFLTYLIPDTLLFLPLFKMFSVIHELTGIQFLNRWWILMVVYPTLTVPFCTWIMIGYFASIPKELARRALRNLNCFSHDRAKLESFHGNIRSHLKKGMIFIFRNFTLQSAFEAPWFFMNFLTCSGSKHRQHPGSATGAAWVVLSSKTRVGLR